MVNKLKNRINFHKKMINIRIATAYEILVKKRVSNSWK